MSKFRFVQIHILYLICNVVSCKGLPSHAELAKSLEKVPSAESTLILAHVFFRHGARSRTKIATYRTDPYKYASHWPLEFGELTKEGHLTSYKLGLELRKRYANFLGPIYYQDLLSAVSSDKSRTEASLQCVLAALFPPSSDDVFLSDVFWRPISYDIIPLAQDEMMALFDKCDNYWNLTSKVTNQTIKDLYDYLSLHTGETIRNNTSLLVIKEAISDSVNFGWKQPDWVGKIYPEPLISASYMIYYDMLRQRLHLGAGGLIRTVTENSLQKLNGTLVPPRRKLFLYSGHEQTIVYALGGLDAYIGQVPQFSSYINFELHYINGTYGFKVFLQNYDNIAPVPINILKQGDFCPLNIFIEKTRWLTKDPKPTCP